MALTLNTSHPLYSALVELVGIDTATGQLASAKTARTFATLGGASYPAAAGTYGKAVRSVTGGGAFSITPQIDFDNNTATVVVVTNSITVSGTGEVRQLVSSTRERTPFIQINDAGKAIFGREYAVAAPGMAEGTTTVTTGSHVMAVTHGPAGSQVYVDGVLEGSNATVLDPRAVWISHIGGVPGFNGISADIVWAAVFNRVLTGAEIATLTSSVGANNVIGLLEGAPAGGTPTVSSVTVSPSAPSVTGGTTQQFTAAVAGTNNPGQGVTWAASAGAINSSGLFTAPTATGASQSITITATSTVDNTKSGTATVTVPATGAPPVTYTGVAVSPSTATVTGLATRQFSATVSGTGAFSTAVTWAVTGGAANGTINSSGLYTAPAATASPRTVTVVATAADGTTTGSAVVTVPATAGAGSFTTEQLVNNSGQVLANISVRWSWFPGGRLGALAGITPVEGVGTTTAGGLLTATGLVAGSGVLLASQWVNGPADDAVYYQAGTVS